jgi:hypothetical protein
MGERLTSGGYQCKKTLMWIDLLIKVLSNNTKKKQQREIPNSYVGYEDEDLPPAEEGYEWKKCWVQQELSPYEILCQRFEKADFSGCLENVLYLRDILDKVRADERTLEPMHVQFVGIPRQGKTQFAMRILMLLEQMGLRVVERTSEDNYFDDLNKHKVNMSRERDPSDTSKFKHFPHIHDPAERMKACHVDVVLLDEFNSKTKNSDDLSTLLNGVTCMPWRPLVADPRGKGETYKPVLWMTTANHEITEHDYNVTALLKRVHIRVIVESGKVYIQRCHEILPPKGNYLGGFRTCQGVYGKFRKERKSTTTSTKDGVSTVTVTQTGQFYEEVRDTRFLNTFVCEHCEEFTFPQMISHILTKTSGKLEKGVSARDNFLDKVSSSSGSLSSMDSL